MSTQSEQRDRCPIDNVRLSKLYHKAVGDRHFTPYTLPTGEELSRCPMHGVYVRAPDGKLRLISVGRALTKAVQA